MKRIKVRHVNFSYNKNEINCENTLIEKLKNYISENKMRKDKLYFVTINDDDNIEVIT